MRHGRLDRGRTLRTGGTGQPGMPDYVMLKFYVPSEQKSGLTRKSSARGPLKVFSRGGNLTVAKANN